VPANYLHRAVSDKDFLSFCLFVFLSFCLSQLTFNVAGFAVNVSWPIQNLRRAQR
jgi:hypothetical protein